MKVLYLDCPSGASGDMILAALLDCGLSLEDFQHQLSTLSLSNYRLNFSRRVKSGITGLNIEIDIKEQQQERHFKDVEEIITSSSLPSPVQEKSITVFSILAEAEAKIHGSSPDKIHFHEVGAVDSILDIVGSVLALYLLGVDKIFASPLPLGSGWVYTASHGSLPLPSPAAAEIIKEYSIPSYGISVQEETVTPTGAALIAAFCPEFSPIPPMKIEKIGYGTGKKDFNFPNLLRVFWGTLFQGRLDETPDHPPYSQFSENLFCEPLEIIEANIDDLNPQVYDYLLESLFSAGALDVFFTPIQMKKNRPAVKVTILTAPQDAYKLGDILLQETTTLGYRRFNAEKLMLPREMISVDIPWGTVRVKVAGTPPHYQNISPEYSDCLNIARTNNIPLKKVYQAVWKALYS